MDHPVCENGNQQQLLKVCAESRAKPKPIKSK